MPRQPKEGDRIGDYTIKEHLNTGAMANAFAAFDAHGKKVFLKSYKSPSCAVGWYKGYTEYQRELKRRLQEHPVGKYCVKMLDQFEFHFGVPTFFQVFEFVHGGEDLGQILARLRKKPTALDWNQRLILAKVMMAAIAELHEAKIVHGDLKPPNLQLFKDPGIEAGYQLKLIDMDFSILSDRRAPWHGHCAYVGTKGYFSPEHLAGGEVVPGPESDVFTCGLILYELLAQGHPYSFDSDEDYLTAAQAHAAKKPKLLGRLEHDGAKTDALANTLHRCLAPSTRDRPSARDVHQALLGRVPAAVPPPGPPPGDPKPSLPPTPKGALQLTSESGGRVLVRVTTPFGRHLLQTLGEDAKFANDLQFVIEKRADGWWIKPPPISTKNLTLVNGEPLVKELLLKNGDRLAIGSRAVKGRSVLPISVTLS